MGFMAIAGGVVGAIKGGIDLALGRQKRKEREEHRDSGRNEQKVADSEAAVERARNANETREDASRRSDDELNRRLRSRRTKAKPK